MDTNTEICPLLKEFDWSVETGHRMGEDDSASLSFFMDNSTDLYCAAGYADDVVTSASICSNIASRRFRSPPAWANSSRVSLAIILVVIMETSRLMRLISSKASVECCQLRIEILPGGLLPFTRSWNILRHLLFEVSSYVHVTFLL